MPTLKKTNIRSLIDKYQANCDRITAIADACTAENRERNEAEEQEFAAITRENQMLQMKMQAATAEHLRENPNAAADATRIIRENAATGRKTEITFVRDVMMVQDVAKGGIVPLNVQDILRPLQEGFILDKVGLPMPTGLVGTFVWPSYEAVEAQIAGEGVALADTKIEFSQLTASPERLGITVPVTNQSLNQTDGLLEMVVREVMPNAIRQLLNKILFSTTKVANATNLKGPFVDIAAKDITALSAVPTFEELNVKMKAAVLETGIEGSHLCWVMTKSMAATLEGQPINKEGVYIPMLQNGMLCGLPVYTTNLMRATTGTGASATTTEYIGLGDWQYQPMGLFGSLRFVVDPYSKSNQDCVNFSLNCDYATKTLRPQAFKLGKVGAAAAGSTTTGGKTGA